VIAHIKLEIDKIVVSDPVAKVWPIEHILHHHCSFAEQRGGVLAAELFNDRFIKTPYWESSPGEGMNSKMQPVGRSSRELCGH
jgi:hypothetical protein